MRYDDIKCTLIEIQNMQKKTNIICIVLILYVMYIYLFDIQFSLIYLKIKLFHSMIEKTNRKVQKIFTFVSDQINNMK